MSENTSTEKISLPGAIILGSVIIAIGIIFAFGGRGVNQGGAPIGQDQATQAMDIFAAAEAIGADVDTLTACLENGENQIAKIEADIDNARLTGGTGTPHSIILARDGRTVLVQGAQEQAVWEGILGALAEGQSSFIASGDRVFTIESPESELSRNIMAVRDADHILGNPDAEYTIIEYSDMECGFCKRLHGTLHTIVDRRNDVNWVYRQFPILSQNSVVKSLASECIAEEKGNDGFWAYIDILMAV
ncbi:MAG: thioredoxin domain-containing protein [Candidatus Pacebacteria bacterium]|nr:thioredoxin domain-containing protein [Candidatus Paceibacterota bacterium]MCD8508088.1 thioredoxin domain-containing protein [Candidatus Paceibacterota bacterium]MCD8528223.1 thioredoxin domain-containing protein [Candidatus Paceibacterota bacterium]MCD8563861.1 thioredoxin domain-containing protein [Candidatus Paceibacterota bacterium]